MTACNVKNALHPTPASFRLRTVNVDRRTSPCVPPFLALTPELRAKYKLDDHQEGALITGVAIGSTAADSNINAGSVIVHVRDALVTSPGDVVDDIGKEPEQKKSSVPVLLSEPSGLRWVPLQLDGS